MKLIFRVNARVRGWANGQSDRGHFGSRSLALLLPPFLISPAGGVGAPAWRAGATASSTPTMSWRDLAGPGRNYREGELPGAPLGASNEGELPGAPHLATQADARSGIVPPRASQADVRSGVVPPHACHSRGATVRTVRGRPDATPGPVERPEQAPRPGRRGHARQLPPLRGLPAGPGRTQAWSGRLGQGLRLRAYSERARDPYTKAVLMNGATYRAAVRGHAVVNILLNDSVQPGGIGPHLDQHQNMRPRP